MYHIWYLLTTRMSSCSGYGFPPLSVPKVFRKHGGERSVTIESIAQRVPQEERLAMWRHDVRVRCWDGLAVSWKLGGFAYTSRAVCCLQKKEQSIHTYIPTSFQVRNILRHIIYWSILMVTIATKKNKNHHIHPFPISTAHIETAYPADGVTNQVY